MSLKRDFDRHERLMAAGGSGLTKEQMTGAGIALAWADRLVHVNCQHPIATACALKWESDHQAESLRQFGLDVLYPYGCDAISHLAADFTEVRKRLRLAAEVLHWYAGASQLERELDGGTRARMFFAIHLVGGESAGENPNRRKLMPQDRKGNALCIGDRVMVPCTVKLLAAGPELCNLSLETDEPMPATNQPNTLTLNTSQVELVMPAGV